MSKPTLLEPWLATTAPARKVKRKLRERDIQKRCVEWARSTGWWARKFSSPAQNAVPDYIFGKEGCTVFVEFKAPRKQPTENQIEEHGKMMEAGLSVHVIDDVENFKLLFADIERQIADIVLLRQRQELKANWPV